MTPQEIYEAAMQAWIDGGYNGPPPTPPFSPSGLFANGQPITTAQYNATTASLGNLDANAAARNAAAMATNTAPLPGAAQMATVHQANAVKAGTSSGTGAVGVPQPVGSIFDGKSVEKQILVPSATSTTGMAKPTTVATPVAQVQQIGDLTVTGNIVPTGPTAPKPVVNAPAATTTTAPAATTPATPAATATPTTPAATTPTPQVSWADFMRFYQPYQYPYQQYTSSPLNNWAPSSRPQTVPSGISYSYAAGTGLGYNPYAASTSYSRGRAMSGGGNFVRPLSYNGVNPYANTGSVPYAQGGGATPYVSRGAYNPNPASIFF